MEMPQGKPIARGATADLYAWNDGYVLKLFHERFSREDIEYEAQLARAVHAAGFRVPQVGEILEITARTGLVYERIDGPSLLNTLQSKPWLIIHLARRQAALQAQLHDNGPQPGVPAQRQRLETKIRQAKGLPEQVQQAALTALAAMPDGDRLCHGDFHPGNILLSPKGDIVIDWIDATCGNPLADVARSTVLLLGSTGTANPFLRGFVRLFHTAYLRHYFRLRPGGEQEYRRWLPIVAAARLDEHVPGQEAWLIRQASSLT